MGVHLTNGEGTLTTNGVSKRIESNNEWSAHLEHFGFNPEEFEVIDNKLEYRCWEAPVEGGKQMMHYYKVGIRSKVNQDKEFDWKWLKKYVTSKTNIPKPPKTKSLSMVLALSDWQIGKQDGDGVEGIVRRVNEMIGQFKTLIKSNKKAGHVYDRLIICGLGDIVEGCDGHYSMQTATVEMNQRDQITVATGLIVRVIKELAPLFPFTTVAVVGGNHGENRKNGKAFTDFGDNFDNLAFDQACRILEENKDLSKKLSWNIADKDLTMTLDVHGKILGLAHGHQFRVGGQIIQQKLTIGFLNKLWLKLLLVDATYYVSTFSSSFYRTSKKYNFNTSTSFRWWFFMDRKFTCFDFSVERSYFYNR